MLMNRWTQGRKAVIIGQPRSVFPQRLAAFWRKQGLEVAIVTRRWDGPSRLEDGTEVVQSVDAESPRLRDELNSLREHWRRFERYVNLWERKRYRRAMGPPEKQHHDPSFTAAFTNAISIPPCVHQLDPAFVFGQDAFSYGLATALCSAHPRLLMPWGSDVFHFAETSSIAFELVRWALNRVDWVVPSGKVGVDRVVSRFGVSPARVRAMPWGIDRGLFRRASSEGRRAFCAKHNISPSSIIVANLRRFMPVWGCDIAVEAFLRLAEEDGRLQFISLGGQGGTEPFIAEARKRVSAKGLERRIRIFDGHIPDESVRELTSVADVFTSLVKLNDMGSLSIQEGACAGGIPVLSDIPSTREMVRRGFQAVFVERLDGAGVAAALRRATRLPAAARTEMVAANQKYLEKYEDRERNLLALLELCANCQAADAGAEGEDAVNALATTHKITQVRSSLNLAAKVAGYPKSLARRLSRVLLLARHRKRPFPNQGPASQ